VVQIHSPRPFFRFQFNEIASTAWRCVLTAVGEVVGGRSSQFNSADCPMVGIN